MSRRIIAAIFIAAALFGTGAAAASTSTASVASVPTTWYHG